MQAARAYSRAKLSPDPRPTIEEPTARLFAGRYRIHRDLGRGTSKTVVLAYDTKLDREVALCLIGGERERVEREAKVMGRLGEHPHIATIYDWGEDEGLVYMVVRHLAGGSLSATGPLGIDTVRRVGRDIADALAHAHAHGIVHRDVKPDNIWLTADGTATLGDFGLALAAGEEQAATIHGTAHYLSPEQARGAPVGPPSDLYSLGATLYEALTGEPPFKGADTRTLAAQHISAEPPPLPEAFGEVATLVHALLAKRPEDRPDATAVREALGGAPGPALFGRDADLAALERAFAAADNGHGGLVGIAGEPGSGKTRLARALAERVDATVSWGRCVEMEGAPAFWPWAEALRDLEPAGLPSEAHRIVPALTVPAATTAEARFALFEAIAGVLRGAAAQRPLLVVIEDLQWADRSSLALLEHLAPLLGRLPILVLVTYRPGEAREALRAIEHERLELRGLGLEDVGRLIEAASGRSASPEVVAAIHRHTGGSPLFVGEVVRMGDLNDLTTVPKRVIDVIGRRLERLPAETVTALQAASVLGPEFRSETLARMLATDVDTVEEALDAAVEAELAGAPTDGGDRWRFAHAIVRDAVLAELPNRRRRALHRAAAEVLEARYDRGGEVDVAELALHFYEGARAAEAERAIRYARVAAEQALLLLAFADAAAHYERAVALTERLETPDAETTCELLLALAAARTGAGQSEAGRAEYRRAAEVAERTRTPELLARAALGFAEWGPYGKVHHEAVRLLERALDRLPGEDAPLRAAALGRLAVRLDPRADQPRREALMEQALAMARRLGDHDLLVLLLGISPLVNWRPQSIALRREHTAEVIALAQAGERQGAMWARIIRVTDALALGELREADAELAAYLRLSDELGRMYYRWYGLVLRGAVAAFRGELETADRLAEEAIATIRPHDADSEQEYSVQRLVLGVLRGEPDRVPADALTGFADRFAELPLWPALLARHALLTGDDDQARRLLARFGDFERADRDPDRLAALTLLADVAAGVGDRAAAHALYARLEPYADWNIVIDRAWGLLGSAARPLGRLAALTGDTARAHAHFERARELNARWHADPWVLQTLLDHATALPEAAPRLRAEALASARALGLPALARRAARL
ncbi:protein kinase domain-containing protein [Solirubrobacter soli]|uniref:protein kinase domain-containing protein n=1 Tax=Solirubrobacter soli TaxID=363832 RepID=UPI000489F03E|nr:AAA family ATPase [Solirubrobacter soli]